MGTTKNVMHNPDTSMRPSSIPITISYTFSSCVVRFHGDGHYTETLFHDGTKVDALPEESSDYRSKARIYGYGDDCAALSREHEFLHSFLAERLRGGASHALWAVAHGQQEGLVAPLWVQEEEEAQVLAFQQYINGSEPGAELLTLHQEAGWDIAALKHEALHLLRHVSLPF